VGVKIAVFEGCESGEEDGREVGIGNRDVALPVGIEDFRDGVGAAVEDLGGRLRVGEIEGGSPEAEEGGGEGEEKECGDGEKGGGAFGEAEAGE
jgi:hypothetical protein